MHTQGRKVFVSRLDVTIFNAQQPCSNLRNTRCYWFEFDSHGDLVDTDCPEHDDGLAAAALAEDCRAFLMDDIKPAWLMVAGE